ncbi:MAG: ankyrin repeat domain-containing protein [Candidatus Amoebophilus sp.]
MLVCLIILAACSDCDNNETEIQIKKPRTVSADEVRVKAQSIGIIINSEGDIVRPYPFEAGTEGEYILHYAIFKGADIQLIKYLLETLKQKYLDNKFKELLSARDLEQHTPFMRAVNGGDTSIIRLLIDYGLRPTKNEIDYAINHSLSQDNAELLAYILSLAKISVHNQVKFLTDILRSVAEQEKANIVEYILKMPNVDIYAKDKKGNTPLHNAIKSNNEKVVRLLLKKGTNNINIKNKEGKTPLILAIEKNSLPVVSTLLREGANPTLPGIDGKLPLEIAQEQLQSQKDNNKGVADNTAQQAIVGKIRIAISKKRPDRQP